VSLKTIPDPAISPTRRDSAAASPPGRMGERVLDRRRVESTVAVAFLEIAFKLTSGKLKAAAFAANVAKMIVLIFMFGFTVIVVQVVVVICDL